MVVENKRGFGLDIADSVCLSKNNCAAVIRKALEFRRGALCRWHYMLYVTFTCKLEFATRQPHSQWCIIISGARVNPGSWSGRVSVFERATIDTRTHYNMHVKSTLHVRYVIQSLGRKWLLCYHLPFDIRSECAINRFGTTDNSSCLCTNSTILHILQCHKES